MPLFKVQISVSTTVEIPVFAETETEALVYAKSTDEWKKDGGFGMGMTLAVVGADEVTDPKQTPWEGACLCWGGDETETTVATALYGNPCPYTDEDEDPEGDSLAWGAYFEREKMLIVQFDAARETPNAQDETRRHGA